MDGLDIGAYAAARLVVDPVGRVPAMALWLDYRQWARAQEPRLGRAGYGSVQQFGRAATAFGLVRGRSKAGQYYAGVTLRRAPADDARDEG